jgi:hypothetical protein
MPGTSSAQACFYRDRKTGIIKWTAAPKAARRRLGPYYIFPPKCSLAYCSQAWY